MILYHIPFTERLSSKEYLIIGKSSELPTTQLPTKKEILQHFFFVKEKMLVQQLTEVKSDIESQISKELILIWEKASLPAIGKNLIEKMIHQLIEKWKTLNDTIDRVSARKKKNC